MYVGTRKRRLRGLGCACRRAAAPSLGQDIYDPTTGTYGPSLPASDNPVAGTGPTSNGTISIPNATIPLFSPGTPLPQVPPGLAYGAGLPPAYSPTAPASLFAGVGQTSLFSKYLPWIVLGVGGIAFVSVLKRR